MAAEHKIKLKLKVGPTSSAPAVSAKDDTASPLRIKIKQPGAPAPSSGREDSRMPDGPGEKERPKLKLTNSGSGSAATHLDANREEQPVAGPSKIRLSLGKTASASSPSPGPAVLPQTPLPTSLPTPSRVGASPAPPSTPQATPSHVTAYPVPRAPAPSGPPKPKIRKPKLPPKPKPPLQVKTASRPPSAIPPRLLSQPPTPKPSSSSLPSTPKSDSRQSTPDVDTPVKQEPDTPGADPVSDGPDPLSLPYEEDDEEGIEGSRRTRGSASKAPRPKKPLRDCLNKIMAELRKKDDYDIFSRPVDLEVFPDYLDAIGGEEKMMDLSTMQNKVDDGEYRSLDMLETDLNTLVDAARAFNGASSLPANSAFKLLQHGLKQINKWRPIAASPSPSRKSTPLREGTAMTDEPGLPAEVPPQSYIPDEMLAFPPNTLEALAVGWNLTGGRRVHAKRIIRTRDRFVGKWRHFALDGTRDLAEMEEPAAALDAWRALGPDEGLSWRDMRHDPKWGEWWTFELGGPLGTVPVPLTPYPRREPLPVERIRLDKHGGPFYEIDMELSALRARPNGPKTLEEHVRPTRFNPQTNTTHFSNLYEKDPVDAAVYLSDLTTGGPVGEAYLRSVQSFLPRDDGDGSEHEWLRDYVERRWRGGIVESDEERIVRQTLRQLPRHPLAKDVYERTMLQDLLVPTKPHDITPFLKTMEEFAGTGIAQQPNFEPAFTFIAGALADLYKLDEEERRRGPQQLGKREREASADGQEGPGAAKRVKAESGASSPLSAVSASDEPGPAPGEVEADAAGAEPTRIERLERLRKELHSLSRFYPLYALKAVTQEFADRVLPPRVRELMLVPRELWVWPKVE